MMYYVVQWLGRNDTTNRGLAVLAQLSLSP